MELPVTQLCQGVMGAAVASTNQEIKQMRLAPQTPRHEQVPSFVETIRKGLRRFQYSTKKSFKSAFMDHEVITNIEKLWP